MSTVSLMTAEELLQLPRDGRRYELVRGELHQMSPSGFEHGQIVVKITCHLGEYVDRHDLGTVVAGDPGFKLEENPDTVLAPDVAFVSHERIKQITNQRAFADISPDLAIEVQSPNDSLVKTTAKCIDWLQAGTLAVVVVNPRLRTVTVHQTGIPPQELTEADTLTIPTVVPGWEMPVRKMFA